MTYLSSVKVCLSSLLFISTLTLVDSRCFAASLSLVDINNLAGVPSAPDANGNFWTGLTSVGTGFALVDSTTGTPTGTTLTLTQVSGAGAGFTGSIVESGPAPGAFNIAAAYGDGWFENTPNGNNGTFTFSGLNPNSQYELTLWGNRDSNWADGSVAITAGTAANRQNFVLQQGTLLTIHGVSNSSGSFAFEFDDTSGNGGSNSVLNVMSFEELAPAAAPMQRSISVNFGIQLNDANSVDVDEMATVGNPDAMTVAGQAWNNILIRNSAPDGVPTEFIAATQGGNSLQLLDNAGGSAATLTSTGDMFAGFGDVSSPSQASSGDAGLYQSYLNLGGTVADESITISDLGSEFTQNGYSVVAFFDLDRDRTYGLTVDDGNVSQTFWVEDVVNPDSDADNDGVLDWVLATGTTEASATLGANYAIFTGLSNSSFTITGVGSEGRATINGLQIIANTAVPEPSAVVTWMLLAAGLFAVRQRRKAGDTGSL